MLHVGKHSINKENCTEQEKSIMARIDAWNEALEGFKANSPLYKAAMEAYAEWDTLPDNTTGPKEERRNAWKKLVAEKKKLSS